MKAKRKVYEVLRDVRKKKAEILKEAFLNRKCAYCGKPLTGRQKYYCSEECRWNFYVKFKDYQSWLEVREKALERDGYRCVKCGRPANEVDHIVPIALGGSMFDLNNLQSLCSECHKRKTLSDLRKIRNAEKLKGTVSLEKFLI